MGEVVAFPGGPLKQRPPELTIADVVSLLMKAADGPHRHLFAHWERRLIAEARRAPRLTRAQKVFLRDLVIEFFDRKFERGEGSNG